MSEFYVVDVETANGDYSSICQIGVAKFSGGEPVQTWDWLVDPQCYFDAMNIAIHGITEEAVQHSPTFAQLYPQLQAIMQNQIVAHHMPFDRGAINRACDLHGLHRINARWLDSAAVVRRAWEEFARSGYGLANITRHLGIGFRHHDALEDAIAAGKVLVRAVEVSGIEIQDWPARVRRPIGAK